MSRRSLGAELVRGRPRRRPRSKMAMRWRGVQVVPDQRPLRAADDGGAHLDRREPVDVDVRDRAGVQLQRQVGRRRPGRRRSGRRRARLTATGRTPAGSTKSRIDRSCGARSQITSMSRWTRPEVDPHRVDVVQLAELAGVQHLADALHRRRVAVGVVAHQRQAALARPRRPAARPPRRGGERLLHQHVLAGAQRGQGDVEVGAGRGGDRDRLHRRVGQHRRRGRSVACTVEYRPSTRWARPTSRSHSQRRWNAGDAWKLRTRLGPQ